ncbi:MAG: hypothetical protein K0R72_409 [Clostridia bacterium]|nr:hypothetical protein [Clostridia bacterium]
MIFFTLMVILFLSLLLISILNTLIFFALKLVTRQNYKEHYLMLPSLFALFIWYISYKVIASVVASITGTSIMGSISSIMFNTSNLGGFIPKLTFYTIIILIITLLLQSISLLTVNIDYLKIFNKIRYFLKIKVKSIKSKIDYDDKSNQICEETITAIGKTAERYKLSFINSFVCNLFIFSLLFFLLILFFWIGTLIGTNII